MSRLKLDFSLSGADRLTFINSYLPTLSNPSPEELETIANYLLWATPDRKNLRNSGIIPPSKSTDWDTSVESLEALSENPAVDESSFRSLDAPQIRVKKEKFSRSEARKEAPPFILSVLEDLFTRIDELDFQISTYELRIGKRTEPIRTALLERLSEGRQEILAKETSKWNQHTYLKARHLLIQLRSDQFTLRDSYKQNVGNSPTARTAFFPSEDPTFEAGINVLPLGLFRKIENSDTPMGPNTLIFKKNPSPSLYTQEELKSISDFYWDNQKNYSERATKVFFDFRDENHVYQLILLRRFIENFRNEEGSTRREVMKAARITNPKVIKDIMPLHPMAALVLKNIASAFQSNQRSMFDFIKTSNTDDVKAFQWFINNTGPGDDYPLLTIDMLWNFFYEKGRDNLTSDIRMILDTYPQQPCLRDDEKRVLKTILIMQAIDKRLGGSVELLKPTEQNISYAFEGISSGLDTACKNIAKGLNGKGILVLNPIGNGKYAYGAAVLAGDQAKIDEYKKTVRQTSSTAKLITEGKLSTVLSLSPALRLRFADDITVGSLVAVTSSDFTRTINQMKDKVSPWHFNAVIAFARDDEEASSFRAATSWVGGA